MTSLRRTWQTVTKRKTKGFDNGHRSPPSTRLCNVMCLTTPHYLSILSWTVLKVLEKCTKNLIGHSRLAFNNHESNIDC